MQLATDNMLDSKMDLEIALNNLVKSKYLLDHLEELVIEMQSICMALINQI